MQINLDFFRQLCEVHREPQRVTEFKAWMLGFFLSYFYSAGNFLIILGKEDVHIILSFPKKLRMFFIVSHFRFILLTSSFFVFLCESFHSLLSSLKVQGLWNDVSSVCVLVTSIFLFQNVVWRVWASLQSLIHIISSVFDVKTLTQFLFFPFVAILRTEEIIRENWNLFHM